MTATTLDGVLLKGTAASRPAASAVAKGTIYSATDTGAITQSDGSSWSTFASAGSGFTNPMTTAGDMIYSSDGSGTPARRAIGGSNTRLASDGSVPVWVPVQEVAAGANITITNSQSGNVITRTIASSGGSSSLTTADATLGADVTMTNANTFYDGPSASLASGTWLVFWKLNVEVTGTTGQSDVFTGKLWDGTNVFDEFEQTGEYTATNVSGFSWAFSGFAVVVLGGTTTVKISCANIRGSSFAKILRDVVDNGATSHTASRLSGVKVA